MRKLKMQETVFMVVSQVFNLPIDEINEESSPDTIEIWDSLMHMNLILALEEEFGIQFREEQIIEMLNVSLIIEAIKEGMTSR
jgi:acyl carrier protein